MLLRIGRWLLEDSTPGYKTLYNATQGGENRAGYQKNFATTLPPTSDHLSLKIRDLRAYFGLSAIEQKTYATPKRNRRQEKRETLINLNSKTIGKACKRFQINLDAEVEVNGEFFELIYSYYEEIFS